MIRRPVALIGRGINVLDMSQRACNRVSSMSYMPGCCRLTAANSAEDRVATKIALSIAAFLSLFFSLVAAASPSDWNRLSDQKIAQLLFPKEKLYLEPALAWQSIPDTEVLDGVAVYKIKKIIANFDDDPEDEMAVLIIFNRELPYAEYIRAIFAILDMEKGEIKIRWTTEAVANAPVDISAIRLINKDKFFALAYTYDRSHAASGSSYQKMEIIRWDGKRFAEIWSYNLRSYDGGNRGGIRHEYSARVDFVDNRDAKGIKVDAIFTAHGTEEEVHKKDYKLKEEFVWKEKEQRYARVREHKRTPLTLLSVYRGMELPSSPEFKYPRVRSISPRGVDEEGKHEVVVFAEMGDAKGESQTFTSVLKIDMQRGTMSTEQSLPASRGAGPRGLCHFGGYAQESSCTIYVKLKDQPPTVYVNSNEWSPKAGTIDSKGQSKESLLDDKAFLFINRAALFVLPDETPAVAVLGTRIPNPILEELNEYGLFIYVLEAQKFVLKGRFSFPKKISVSGIEAFTLFTSEFTKSYRPAGILALDEGSYRRGLYIFK